MSKLSIFWFRRDLRLHDNTALYHALDQGIPVQAVFIFDTQILAELPVNDKRVNFIYESLKNIHTELKKYGASLKCYFTTPELAFKQLINEYDVRAVYTNHDYEPYAIKRDDEIKNLLNRSNIPFLTYKDHVIFERDEIVKDDGKPYTVFTPYSKKWKSNFQLKFCDKYVTEIRFSNFHHTEFEPMISLQEMGFEFDAIMFPSKIVNENIITAYHETRDYPALQGTTQLSLHLRFGTISIRELVKLAFRANEKYLNELIWREFYQSILWHFPQVIHQSFKPQYDTIPWRNNEQEFKAWCEGKTGYPIVDAGMRELNETGWMHNRVRMIVASFLTKHLLVDWRWGEAYFAKKLLDFELASNNGGWQWAAGCGVDAAPYFRIFNPTTQTLKFDKNLNYIKKWVPEFESFLYAKPIVEHKLARERCLATYKNALKNE
jgi:deoxyribodipyrimidine photo-lyase